jgi:hypothetical protein
VTEISTGALRRASCGLEHDEVIGEAHRPIVRQRTKVPGRVQLYVVAPQWVQTPAAGGPFAQRGR